MVVNMVVFMSFTTIRTRAIAKEKVEEVTEVIETKEDNQEKVILDENTGNTDNEVINPVEVCAEDTPNELVSLTEEVESLETEEIQTDDEIHAPVYYYVIDDGYEYYMDTEWQDYLYSKLLEYNRESQFKIMMALIYHESKFEPDTISSSDDYGLTQINKFNHKWLSKKLGITNYLDPYQSIDAGVFMFDYCLKRTNTLESALVKYNKGYASSNDSSKYSRGVIEDEYKLVEL
jgi:hypothetical protein